MCGEYLAVIDYKSFDKLVHVFDKHTFKHILSLGDIGQGPTEIAVIGSIAWNEKEHDLYVTDNGQRKTLGIIWIAFSMTLYMLQLSN